MDHYIDDDIVLSHSGIPNSRPDESLSSSWSLYSVLVAVFAILIIQYRSSIISFFRYAIEEGLRLAMVEILIERQQIASVFYQTVCQVLRRFSYVPGAQSADHTQPSMANSNIPPPLEIIKDNKSNPENDSSYTIKQDIAETTFLNKNGIEPAFLHEKDYPPGWLVYHPRLGVVPKDEAERYDRENATDAFQPILTPSIEAR